MRAIIWDHLSRCWLLWVGGALFYVLAVGAGQPLKPDLSNTLCLPLPMLWVVVITGYYLVGIGLRVLGTLPVSARDMGRAWWWLAVGLPAIMVAGLTGLVYLFLALNDLPVSGVACFNYGLTTALLFGPLYCFFTGPFFCAAIKWANRVLSFLGVLFILSLFPSFQPFYPPTLQWKIVLSVAAVLTVASWFGAERFAQAHLGVSPASTGQPHRPVGNRWLVSNKWAAIFRRLTGGRLLSAPGANGPGGLRLLFQTLFCSIFREGLVLVVLFGILPFWPFSDRSESDYATILWLVALSFVMSALPQIRWLRTSPVNATQLAGVLILAPVTAMLGFLVLGNLILGLFYPSRAMSFLTLLREGCLLEIALVTVAVPLKLWWGQKGALVIPLMLFMFGDNGSIIQKLLSLPANVTVAVVIMTASYLLTIRAWNAGYKSFRPDPSQANGWLGGVGNEGT